MTEATVSAPGSALAPELEALLQARAGARYLRADLQVHTPVDPAFDPKREPRDANERRALAREYLEAGQSRGIELVGITEHNDVSWIDDLRYAARGLGMHLLPGFEVESREGIHVLCLFEPEAKVSHLEDCLARLGLTKKKREGQRLELRTDQYFPELIEFLQVECGGICIAAHIESAKGLLSAIREGARVDTWKTPVLLAAQLSRPPDEIESGNGRIVRDEDPKYKRERLPAYVLTSDCRSFATIGEKSTWIKMDEVSVEGLRQAFLDPESRIAYTDPAERRQGARLLGIRWEGGFLDGIGFPLNGELNTLIGGKGTGKSTVIETIRYAFGLDYRTQDVDAAASTLLEHAFRSGSKVSVIVETDAPRERYVIERTAPHAPVVRDKHGQPQPDFNPRMLLRPCVYGQKEIYGIAQDMPALLSLLDGFAEEELRRVSESEQALLDRLRQNAAVLVDSRRRIDDSEAKLSELPTLIQWRAQFREAGFEDLLSERRRLDREERLFETAAEALAERLNSVTPRVTDDRLSRALELPAGEEELPNAELILAAYKLLEEADRQWESAFADLRTALSAAAQQFEQIRTRWRERRESRAAEFDKALRELQSRMPDVDPERYLDVERRIERLSPLREAIEQLTQGLEDARKERDTLLIELDDIRAERYRIRERAAKQLNAALASSLLIEVTHRGDRAGFIKRVADLKTGARADNLRRMVDRNDFTPALFAASVRARDLESRLGLAAGQANSIERSISEETLLDLEVEDLPDSVELKLDVSLGDGNDYRSLDRLSPGQKSTAILLLIMLESKDPLLIDQPEDDLDNRFIYEDIVKRLRAAKPSRQFLIATHNANIPILGDAEQIVALDAKELGGPPVRSFVRAHGSIDALTVREAAEEILEGGREAFALRQAKYHF